MCRDFTVLFVSKPVIFYVLINVNDKLSLVKKWNE